MFECVLKNTCVRFWCWNAMVLIGWMYAQNEDQFKFSNFTNGANLINYRNVWRLIKIINNRFWKFEP